MTAAWKIIPCPFNPSVDVKFDANADPAIFPFFTSNATYGARELAAKGETPVDDKFHPPTDFTLVATKRLGELLSAKK
jgi:hypothetical protein